MGKHMAAILKLATRQFVTHTHIQKQEKEGAVASSRKSTPDLFLKRMAPDYTLQMTLTSGPIIVGIYNLCD